MGGRVHRGEDGDGDREGGDREGGDRLRAGCRGGDESPLGKRPASVTRITGRWRVE